MIACQILPNDEVMQSHLDKISRRVFYVVSLCIIIVNATLPYYHLYVFIAFVVIMDVEIVL